MSLDEQVMPFLCGIFIIMNELTEEQITMIWVIHIWQNNSLGNQWHFECLELNRWGIINI